MRSASLSGAIRILSRRPGLLAARILTVAAIIAAVASVLAIANATILKRLPYPSPEQLLRITVVPATADPAIASGSLFPIAFARFRDRVRGFERLEGSWPADHALTGRGEPQTLPGARVTAGYLSMLGADVPMGRAFSEEEAASGARVVVLSHGLWLRLFGGDSSAIGRSVTIDREPHVVIGVLSREFAPALGRPDFYLPLDHRRHDALRATAIQAVGRLGAEGNAAQVQRELDDALASAQTDVPDLMQGYIVRLTDLRDSLYGSRRPAVLTLAVAVVALILVAIANLTNLTIADLLSRQADFALRTALGGSRLAIVAPEVVQCVAIGAAGAMLGLTAAFALLPQILALDRSGVFVSDDVSIDWRTVVVSFAAAIAMMAATVVVPLFRMAGGDLVRLINAAGRRAAGTRATRRFRIALVCAQAAVTLVLLSSGALIVSSLQKTAAICPGFDSQNVITAQLRLTENAFPGAADRARFVSRLLDRLRNTPGVAAAGTTLNPFRGGGGFTTNIRLEDSASGDDATLSVQYRRVSPGYFEALRIRVVQGRAFTDNDDLNNPPVAIVSRSFAERFWPGGDAIGRRVRRGNLSLPPNVVVGVVDDVRDAGLATPPQPTLYTPYYQGSSAAAPVALVVRSAGPWSGAIDDIKRAVWSIDPNQPLFDVVGLDDYLDAGLGPQRFRAILVAVCGSFGLLLATIGTYAVTARSVSERTREAGIRIAVGGDPRSIWWTMASGGVKAVIAGAVLGMAASAAVDTGIARLLPEIDGSVWRFRIAAAIALSCIGGAAAIIASRKTVSIDPVRALQAD